MIESRGLEPVAVEERRGHPIALLWTWLAANIGVLGITLGAGLVTVLGLNLWQAALAALVGSVGAYLFVALVATAGPLGGAPTLLLSRAVFGVRGNLGPAVVSWVVLVGAETVMCATAAFALLSILTVAGVSTGAFVGGTVVVLLVAGAAVLGIFGHATILWIQKWLAWIFGALTLIVVGFLLAGVDWAAVLAAPGADLAAVASGIGLVAAGSGIARLSVGPDLSRYLPDAPGVRRQVVLFTVLGAGVPLILLIATGSMLATSGGLDGGGDPVGLLGSILPDWLFVPYLVVVMAGLLAAADLSMYSAGLSLQATGLRISRRTAVIVNAVLIAAGALYITVIVEDLFSAFAAFISLFAMPLAAWAGVFLIDLLGRGAYDPEGLLDTSKDSPYWFRAGFHWPALIAWLTAILLGVLCTRAQVGDAVWFAGPLADTWVGHNSLGWLVAGVSACAVYWVLEPLTDGGHLPGRAHPEQ